MGRIVFYRTSYSPISQNQKVVRLKGTTGGHLVQLSCSSSATQNQLLRTVSRWLLNIFKDRDSSTSLGNTCQCLVTLTVESFLMCRQNLLCFSLSPLALDLNLDLCCFFLTRSPGCCFYLNWWLNFQAHLNVVKLKRTIQFGLDISLFNLNNRVLFSQENTLLLIRPSAFFYTPCISSKC